MQEKNAFQRYFLTLYRCFIVQIIDNQHINEINFFSLNFL